MDISTFFLYFFAYYVGTSIFCYLIKFLIGFFTKPKNSDINISFKMPRGLKMDASCLKKRLEESLRQSSKMNHKLKTCYEPTYPELKEFYQKYVDRVKQRKKEEENSGIWSTEEIKYMNLEEYLDKFIENEYYGNNLYHYCCEQCAFMWSFDPNTGRSQIWM